MTQRAGWTLLIMANVLFYCVLGFYRATDAAPPKAKEPFANAVQQRMEMIVQLKEIRNLLKEQNALLASGKVKVVVVKSEGGNDQ